MKGNYDVRWDCVKQRILYGIPSKDEISAVLGADDIDYMESLYGGPNSYCDIASISVSSV